MSHAAQPQKCPTSRGNLDSIDSSLAYNINIDRTTFCEAGDRKANSSGRMNLSITGERQSARISCGAWPFRTRPPSQYSPSTWEDGKKWLLEKTDDIMIKCRAQKIDLIPDPSLGSPVHVCMSTSRTISLPLQHFTQSLPQSITYPFYYLIFRQRPWVVYGQGHGAMPQALQHEERKQGR